MPHTNFMPTYQVTLTANEYRLITLGLARKIKDGQDAEDALVLNIQLAHQRAQHIGSAKEAADIALDAAKKLHPADQTKQ